ncbi:hypothetical protein WA171_004440 [Blastocystis sp. BT1]
MARQPEFISGLVTYMSDADEEVRLMAARAIEFLSTHPSNKEIVAEHPGLVEKMKEFAESENDHARAISRRTLNNIKNYLKEADVEFLKLHPCEDAGEVKQTTMIVKTYTFSIDRLEDAQINEALQTSIIQIAGVTSITMEKPKKKMIVTVRQEENEKKESEIRTAIERVLAAHSMDVSGIDDDSGFVDDIFENEEKGDNAITMYGFSSIESRLEKKKQEREAKQKKEKKMSWLFGKVSSAMSSWW